MLLAISTRSVQFANVLGVEVLNCHSPAAIVLQYLVAGLASTSSVDVRCARGLLESGSILADINPPYVVERASTQAVYAFAVVRPNDDVGEDSAVFEDEDCVSIAALSLVIAG